MFAVITMLALLTVLLFLFAMLIYLTGCLFAEIYRDMRRKR